MTRILTLLTIVLAAHAIVPTAAQGAQRHDYRDFPRAAFDREFRASSGGVVMAALERNYPQEARALMDRLYEMAYAHRTNLEEVTGLAAQEMASVLRSKADDLGRSPESNLRIVLQHRLSLYQAMQRDDVALCARLTFATPGQPEVLPARFSDHTSANTVAIIDAEGAGLRSGRTTPRGPPSDSDLVAWVASMRRLDTDGQALPVLADPARRVGASPALKCRAGILLFESALALPPEEMANIAVHLLQTELGIAMPSAAASTD